MLPKGCDHPILSAGEIRTWGQTGLLWQTSLLPYVEQEGLWKMVTFMADTGLKTVPL